MCILVPDLLYSVLLRLVISVVISSEDSAVACLVIALKVVRSFSIPVILFLCLSFVVFDLFSRSRPILLDCCMTSFWFENRSGFRLTTLFYLFLIL